MSYSGLKERQ